MPAETFTQYAGLNKWRLSDKPGMDEFNEDSLNVDYALMRLSEKKADIVDLKYSATASYSSGVFILNGLPG